MAEGVPPLRAVQARRIGMQPRTSSRQSPLQVEHKPTVVRDHAQ
jgi:hypothetical protein